MDNISASVAGQVPTTQCGGTMGKKKPGWMLPLPPAFRRAKIRWSEPMPRGGFDEREPEVGEAPTSADMAEALEDAFLHGGEATDAARERMADEAWPPLKQREAIEQAGRDLSEQHGRASQAEALRYYPETAGERVALHNLRDRGRRGTLTAPEWAAICQAWGGHCAYCASIVPRPVIEHVVPICRGGRTELANIVPSCHRCNRRKGVKSIDEFLKSDLADFRQRQVAALAAARAALGGNS